MATLGAWLLRPRTDANELLLHLRHQAQERIPPRGQSLGLDVSLDPAHQHELFATRIVAQPIVAGQTRITVDTQCRPTSESEPCVRNGFRIRLEAKLVELVDVRSNLLAETGRCAVAGAVIFPWLSLPATDRL